MIGAGLNGDYPLNGGAGDGDGVGFVRLGVKPPTARELDIRKNQGPAGVLRAGFRDGRGDALPVELEREMKLRCG